MAKFVPLSTPEQNNPTNLFVSIGAGLVSGLIKTVEGVVSLGAELVDLGADSNTAGKVEQFFDDINIFEDEAQDRVAGRLVEVFTQIGLPAGAGAKLATKLADKAIKAKKTGKYANLKSKNVLSGANKARELNLRVDSRLGLKPGTSKRFAAGVFGGAAGETLVADVEEIGTFGDFFDGPTALDTTESEGRDEAGRRLLNRLKFGTESLFITPFVFGAGKAGKALATRGQELAYSNSVIDRWINKYIRSPFQPQGDLGPELFASETAKAGLKARDTFRAEELVNNITKEVNNIYPKADKFFDSSTKEEQKQFYKKLNDVLFEGDLKDPVNPKALDEIVKFLDDKKVSKESTQNIVGNLNAARQEFTNLISILERNTEGKISAGAKDLQKIMKDRVEGWLGGTYRIFEKPAGITKLFRSDPYTDEAYTRAVNLFRRYLQKTDPNAKRDADGKLLVERNELEQLIPQGDDYFQEAKIAVDNIINEVKIKKKPGGLPDVTYQNKTAMTKTKSFEKAVGKGSKVFRELFGEIEDPRYSIFNAMTNLSAVARTAKYFDDVVAKNDEVQAKGGRGFFWNTEDLAKRAVNSSNTGIEIVPMSEVISLLPGRGAIVSSLNNKFTTKEIAEAIKNANDVGGGLTAAIRGREGANPAEKAVTWFYRNLLLFPKAV